MTATTATRIAAKTAKALAELEATQRQAATLAGQASPASSVDWTRYAIQLAEAEGAAQAWHRINATVEYCERNGTEVTPAVVLETIAELLSGGADDTWSGRTNDSQRARFDGICKACSSARWLVTD